jgi:hypothetical protein
MSHLINTVAKAVRVPAARKWILASAAALTLGGGLMPTTAMADRYDRRDDRHDNRSDRYDRRDDQKRIDVDIRIGEPRPRFEERTVKVWVPPVYRTERDRKWIEPVYRTVCEKRWIEPVYRDVCEKVWVPARYETREVRYHDGHCFRTRVERVLLCDGHFEEVHRKVCVSEGRFEAVERRECVSEGRWEECSRQVLVCDGHYEFRKEMVRCDDRRNGFDVINPLLAGLNVELRR